mmetsp:Transcript_152155/g.265230  ORF Transcript_152155/g.265230 Transcript_152155/m.265230 type:complete len:295 (+) Transcript_152155:53-937(+)
MALAGLGDLLDAFDEETVTKEAEGKDPASASTTASSCSTCDTVDFSGSDSSADEPAGSWPFFLAKETQFDAPSRFPSNAHIQESVVSTPEIRSEEHYLLGQVMLIQGLRSRPEYNGHWARVEAYDAIFGRFVVRVLCGAGPPILAKLREENLAPDSGSYQLQADTAAVTARPGRTHQENAFRDVFRVPKLEWILSRLDEEAAQEARQRTKHVESSRPVFSAMGAVKSNSDRRSVKMSNGQRQLPSLSREKERLPIRKRSLRTCQLHPVLLPGEEILNDEVHYDEPATGRNFANL